ncbi:MAG: septal ring lytic transglycosylase RlpA family protein [Stellaceae bacterium]
MRAANSLLVVSLASFSCLLAACTSPHPVPASPVLRATRHEKPSFSETGAASWYGKAHQGRRTADGERFDRHEMTAAHRSLPFGTIVRVKNETTGQTVKVRINDRGPYVGDRIIDLSAAAGKKLGIHEDGVATVRLEVFSSDQASSGETARRADTTDN